MKMKKVLYADLFFFSQTEFSLKQLMSCSYFRKDGYPCKRSVVEGMSVCNFHLASEERKDTLIIELSHRPSKMDNELITSRKIKTNKSVLRVSSNFVDIDDTTSNSSTSSEESTSTYKGPSHFTFQCYNCDAEVKSVYEYDCGHRVCSTCSSEITENSYASIARKCAKCPSCKLVSSSTKFIYARRRLPIFCTLCE